LSEESRASRAAQEAQAAAAAAPRSAADPDVPGQDDGARCAGSEQYADEEPTGMRGDAAAAWLAADAAAAAQGVFLCLADGKRSRAQQQATYDQYVTQYGQAMAAQYVLPPEKSAHVLGLAIDVQPYAGYTWLEATGGALGFCRIYDNEAWHFEYSQDFVTGGCPARLPHPGG
jgi:LAS superfamily LD-carboxypeptidase LdcB